MAKKAKSKKAKPPVKARTSLPKLSLVPAAKAEAGAPEPVAAEQAPAAKGKGTRVAKAKPNTAERPSALNAVAEVLADSDVPMTAPQLIAAMADRKLWTSPGGKTPGATLHAAISKEIAGKRNASRFRKVGRGLFDATVGSARNATDEPIVPDESTNA